MQRFGWSCPSSTDKLTVMCKCVSSIRVPLALPVGATMLAGLILVLGGCFRSERTVDVGVREGILHLNNGAEVPDLDPHTVTGTPEFHVMDALFEGLVEQDPVTREILPALATSWTVSEDQTRYTFRLQPDAKWSDGRPLVAEDFVRSYERALNPALGSDYAYLLKVIRKGADYLAGRNTNFSEVGVTAVSGGVLQIELEHPVPYFLTLLTYPCWRPLPMHVVEAHEGVRRRGTAWTRAGNLVSSGPFRLTRWEQNRVLVVEKNPHYWDVDAVALNALHFYPIESVDTEERMFRSGQLHLTHVVPVTKIATYRTMENSPLRIDPQLGTYFFRFNVTRPPLDDARVRRALSLAIDREAIVRRITRAGQAPAGSFSPPGAGKFKPLVTVEFEPEAARRHLAAAGYAEGVGFPEIELLYNTSEVHRTIAEAVQQMWKTTLGIDVVLYNQEWKVYLDSLVNLDFNVARSGWVAVYDDANQFLEIFTTGNPNNRTGWSNPAYDRMHSASMAETDPQRRRRLLQQLDAMLVEEAIVAPIYHYTNHYLIDPRVKGWNPGPLDKRRYKYVSFAEKE